ncbi:MAG TPA: TetR/AcrR family transcriptional regulator [Pyrinomonadaceae bacterium]
MSKQIAQASPEQPPLVGGRMAGEERRQQLVRVAMKLFSQRGFRGTTTKEIAQAAGVSEAMVFRHFATKEELYAAILDDKACAGEMTLMCERVAGAVAGGDDRAVFESLAAAMLQHHEHDPEFLRLLLYSALEGHELFEMFWNKNVHEMAHFICSYIGARQKAGALREIEPMVAGRAFIGMIVYHSLVTTLFDKSRTLLDIQTDRAAHEFTEIFLRGVTTASAPSRARVGKRAASTVKSKKKHTK